MILKRLLSPNWRKSAPGLKPSAKNAAQLAEVARTATDPGQRRQACKTLSDAALLRRIAVEDEDAGVREVAAARLRKVLCETADGASDLDNLIAELRLAANPVLNGHVAVEARATELRIAAIELLEEPAPLTECALGDSVAAVRLAAAERLQDKEPLERIARQIGKKDKKVYRLVKQKLREITEREQAPARLREEAEGLCERLEKLGRRGTWVQDKALLELIEKQWDELGTDLPGEITARFDTARQTFNQGYEAYREANLARLQEEEAAQRRHDERQALIAEMETLADATEVSEATLDNLRQRWAAIAPLPDSRQRSLQQAFDRAALRVEQAAEQQRGLRQRDERLRRLADRAEAMLDQSGPLDGPALADWRKQGDKLVAMQPDDPPANRHRELLERLQKRMDKQIAHAEQKLTQYPKRLAELSQALDEGVLRKAGALHQSLSADLELIRASGVSKKTADGYERELRRLTPRLRELQNWRKWGTDQHREEMCQTMESLLTNDIELEQLADRVQQLQSEWKKLDSGGSPVNESLWKRFHAAADAAYERCRPYLEQQAEIRRANRNEREKLCAELEAFLDQVDWERMDWKKAVRAEREMRASWRTLGPVEPRHRRGLEKRFRAAIKRLDANLAEERARNRELKKSLIAQAGKLAEQPGVDKAIEQVKDLQRQWHTTVPSKRSQENQLWQQFRGACDRVFEQKREQQQAYRDELAGHARIIEELCVEAERLADCADEPDALTHKLHKIQGTWDQHRYLKLPKSESGRLEKRWHTALQGIRRQIEAARQAAERRQLDRLRDLAALCAELEKAVEGGQTDAASADTWRERWEQLPQPDDAEDRDGIRRRFDNALEALVNDAAHARWKDKMAANARARAYLCLHLEVLTGIDSPAEATEERLAFQVNRLSDRLGHGARDPLDEPFKVERAWYHSAPAAAADADVLEARFERARQATSLQQSAVSPNN